MDERERERRERERGKERLRGCERKRLCVCAHRTGNEEEESEGASRVELAE